MSHDPSWRGLCASTGRDSWDRWLWRLVRLCEDQLRWPCGVLSVWVQSHDRRNLLGRHLPDERQITLCGSISNAASGGKRFRSTATDQLPLGLNINRGHAVKNEESTVIGRLTRARSNRTHAAPKMSAYSTGALTPNVKDEPRQRLARAVR